MNEQANPKIGKKSEVGAIAPPDCQDRCSCPPSVPTNLKPHLDVIELLTEVLHRALHLLLHPLQKQADVVRLFLQVFHILVVLYF